MLKIKYQTLAGETRTNLSKGYEDKEFHLQIIPLKMKSLKMTKKELMTKIPTVHVMNFIKETQKWNAVLFYV